MKHFQMAILLAAVFLLPACADKSESIAAAPANTASESQDAGRFAVVYPGVWTARERPLAEKYLADNRALNERGPVNIQALVSGKLPKDTVGLGPVVHATEEWVRYFNSKYDPENPLRNDAAHARRAGFADIVAYPTIGTNDDAYMIPFPSAARDKLMVSDLNHSITNHRPVHPGDTLYMVMNSREVTDLTPSEGSTYRSLAIHSTGSVYNQRGEKVNEVIFRVTESMRQYQNEADRPANPGFAEVWDAPDWQQRPAHVYTEADYTRIKGLMAAEAIRGAEPRYWHDVKIGDLPTPTIEGPVLASPSPTMPWGMGTGGSRTIKKELLDAELFKTLVRGEKDGIYRLPNRADYVPAVPASSAQAAAPMAIGAINTADIHKEGEKRAVLVNFLGREYAIRHLTHWMGDGGWLHNIRWSIMDPRGGAQFGKPSFVNPGAERYLHRVPAMNDKFVNAHGLTQDVAIVKSYVYDKYARDGQFYAELVWWIETITGDIFQEGGATIRLPAKPTG